jgi:hypothetical protein
MTDLVRCGSRDSRMDSRVAWKASWHRSRCERTVWLAVSVSWSRRGARRVCEASEAAANARGAHVLKDRMPRPPSLTGRVMRALSTARDGAGDAAARIRCTELARVASGRSQRGSKSSERRDRYRCRRFCCRHCRSASSACWWGMSTSLPSKASSAAILASRKRSLTVVGPMQLPRSCMPRSFVSWSAVL